MVLIEFRKYTMMLLNTHLEIIENSVKRVWEKLQNCSYYFITESDFQFELMRCISEELESSKLLSPTEYNFSWSGKSIRPKLSVILHSEYPRTKKSADRFNIVLLDDSSMKNDAYHWNEKIISVAIQLKYGWGLNKAMKDGFLADINKLRDQISSKRIHYGIAILLATEDISKEKLKQISEQVEETKSDKIKTYIITPSGIIPPLTTISPEYLMNN
ncbi:MAG TPA: hypothetical protein VNN20_02370 [Thermodesulfobacteriota bacterium]|nr:hypothetical protein [Thermodesulfobacteriota bacterium]